PAHIVNLELGYKPSEGLGGRLRYHWEDGYYIDNQNEHESEDWGRLDAQVSYGFGTRRNYLFSLEVINLLDKKYADYTSATSYSPALPLSAYLTMTVEF
ncbi:MAG: TonB-dependent receptor, partial [Candidatus Electrothrix sp. ATG1]|nr:TonB-dependent receptor [Candidatus Electrothrix sp. ATG1]